MDVMFVVPAFRRYEISAASFASLDWTIDELEQCGHQCEAVVIADDENLDLAAEHGFETLRRPNQIGAKLNDGFAYAAEREAEFVVYVGSDDLLDPTLVCEQIKRHRSLGDAGDFTVISSRTSSVVSPDGQQMLNIRIGYACGDGVQLRPTRLLARVGHRPIPPGQNRAMDGATWRALERRGPLAFEYVDAASGQITDLKSNDVQVTPFEKFLEAAAVDDDRISIDSISDQPWVDLGEVFPSVIVDAARAVYEPVEVAA